MFSEKIGKLLYLGGGADYRKYVSLWRGINIPHLRPQIGGHGPIKANDATRSSGLEVRTLWSLPQRRPIRS